MTATIIKRRPDWRAQFSKVIDEIKRQPFAWDGMDCVSGLAGRVVLAITGMDLYSHMAGRYQDAEGAFRLMRSLGFADLADLVASVLPELDHPARAAMGDIVAIPVDTAFKHALGVVSGERVFVLSEKGLGTVDRAQAVRAFRVG